ncbi:MAG: DUF2383 domain-containing protein [Pseudomonadota bacterium]
MPDTHHVVGSGEPIQAPERPVEDVTKVTTDVVDVIQGYKAMEDRAEPDLLPVVQRLLALHETHAAELFEHLQQIGGDADEAGSMMGLVHQAVATGRDWFDGLDASAEPALIRGERRLIDTYDTAVAATLRFDETRQMLERQRDALKAQVDALEA